MDTCIEVTYGELVHANEFNMKCPYCSEPIIVNVNDARCRKWVHCENCQRNFRAALQILVVLDEGGDNQFAKGSEDDGQV